MITIDKYAIKNADSLLAKIAIEYRGPMVKKALAKTGDVVVEEAKRRVVRGDPRHNPDAKPLHDTIGKIVRQRGGGTYVIVGAQYPAGAHAHLVEGWREPHKIVVTRGKNKGMDTGFRAMPKPFLVPAVDATRFRQIAAFEDVIKKGVAKLTDQNMKRPRKPRKGGSNG